MNTKNSTVAANTWVVIHVPDRVPSPYAAYRYQDGKMFGYALDGFDYEIVFKQLPPGGVRRNRTPDDLPAVVEYWDY